MVVPKTRAKSTVQMKLIDDKLKIIDDVPTSAVEMAVKEKVISKVQYIHAGLLDPNLVVKSYWHMNLGFYVRREAPSTSKGENSWSSWT